MPVSRALLEKVYRAARMYLLPESNYRLGGVAMAIEESCCCRILMEPLPDVCDPGAAQGCMMTCEAPPLSDGEYPECKWEVVPRRYHFLFYVDDPTDPDAARFAVAHELGHCVLHWPLKKRRRRLREDKSTRTYYARYIKTEEEEADAFACLLMGGAFRRARREKELRVTENLLEKYKQYRKKKYFQSDYYVPIS